MPDIFDSIGSKYSSTKTNIDVSKVWTDLKPIAKAEEPQTSNVWDKVKDTGNWFVETLDNLNRGNYATANLVKDFQDGKIQTAEDAWDSMGAGFSRTKRTSFVDVVKDAIPGEIPKLEVPLGIAGDIILDPINLVTPASITKAAKLLNVDKLLKNSLMLKRATDTMKGVGKTLSATKPVDWLGESFIPGWRLRNHPGAYKRWRDLQLELNSIRRTVKEELAKEWDTFSRVAKAMGLNPEKEASKMIRMHEAGEGAHIAKEFQPFYKKVADGLEEIGQKEVRAGLMQEESLRDFYFPHILERGLIIERDGKLIVKKQKGFFTSLKFRGKTSFQLQRQYDTIEELKAGLFQLRNEKGLMTDVAPIDNWFRGYAVRRFVSESALAWNKFTDDVLSTWGTKLDDFMKEGKLFTDEEIGKAGISALKGGHGPEVAQKVMEAMDSVAFKQGLSFVTNVANLRAPKMAGTVLTAAKQRLMQKKDVLETALDAGLIDETAELYRTFKKASGKGVVTLSSKDVKTLKGKGVYLLPSEIAKEVKDTFKVFSSSQTTKQFIGAYDKVMHMWKSMATSMRLPFHARNAMSNTWLMYLSGVSIPKMPKRIWEASMAQLSQMTKDSTFMFQGFAGDELIEMANRYGVKAYGWMGADVPTQLQKELHIITSRSKTARTLGAGEQAWNPFQYWSRAGRKIGSGIEDNARLAVFMDQMKKMGIKKGMEPAEITKRVEAAAQHTKKYMFDYTELTEFERDVMKRFIPFYTWMRKNIPLQLESLLTQPHKYARLGDFERELFPDSSQPSLEKKLMPNWMEEARYHRTDFVDDFGNPVYYSIDLPTKDLERMGRAKDFIGALTPAVAILQIATNTKFWPNPGKLEEPGQRVVAPVWATWMPDWLKQKADVGLTFNTADGKLVYGMNPKWKFAMETSFPFLSDWSRAYPGEGQFQVNVDGKWRAISYATGIKFRPLDKKRAALAKYYKLKEAQSNLSKAARWQGPDFNRQKAMEILSKTLNK